MTHTHMISLSIIMMVACGSSAYAGPVVDLGPGDFTDTLSGITNSEMPELIGVTQADIFQDFAIYGFEGKGGAQTLYQGTLLTRIVRSNETGNLTFNYRLLNPNPELMGSISHVEVSGYQGLQTRVEFRNELNDPEVEGPSIASRSEDGDILTFDFNGELQTQEESRFFFAMVDTTDWYADAAIMTIYLQTGESVSLSVAGANPAIPSPGTFGLLGIAGLVSARRRR